MSLFQARRKPKRVARDDPDEAQAEIDDSGPVVRRPGAVKQKSKLRVSFDPSNEDNDSSGLPSESEPSSVVRPLRRGIPSSLQDRLKQTSIREDEAARPSYSKSALDELRASTPSTPKDLSIRSTPDPEDHLALSIESKFGKLPTSSTSLIPSASEISERKARRARLALEQAALPASTTDPNSEDYIPLDAYDSDGEFKPTRMQVGTWHQPTKEADSRLVHDDEDIAEGFEEFTEPSGPLLNSSSFSHKETSTRNHNRLTTDSLNLTSRSAKANAAAERSAIRAAIEAAEVSHAPSNNKHNNDSDNSASDSDDETRSNASSDDAARHHAYELSQTSHALPSTLNTKYMIAHRRPKQPRETTPIVKLSAGLAGLRDRVEALRLEKARLKRRLQECRGEREAVRERQEFIQRSLEEGARQLEGVMRDFSAPAPNRESEVDSSTDGAGVAAVEAAGAASSSPRVKGTRDAGSGSSDSGAANADIESRRQQAHLERSG